MIPWYVVCRVAITWPNIWRYERFHGTEKYRGSTFREQERPLLLLVLVTMLPRVLLLWATRKFDTSLTLLLSLSSNFDLG